MNALPIIKTAVGYATTYSIGTAAAVFLANNRNHSDNRLVEATIDASTVVTGYALGSLVQESVRRHTDKKIDAAYAWFNNTFKNEDKK